MRRPVMIAGKPQVKSGRVITASRCLPETITVALSGFADAHPDTHRVTLTLTACQGTGGTGYATAPKPDDAPGALSDAVVEDGGSGHAAIGRVAPTLAGDGNATATVTVAEDDTGPCGWPVWRVTAVAITDPGTFWYTDNAAFYLGYGGEVTQVFAASLRVRTVRAEPTALLDFTNTTGSGAFVTVTLAEGVGFDGRQVWSVDEFDINDGSSGYAVDDYIVITADGGETTVAGILTVTSVNGSGSITGLAITEPGELWNDTGEADVIEIDDGGEYYTEDAGEPVLLATVTVTPDSEGTGQTFTVDINDDPDDANFGRIEGITATDGGTGHTATINEQAGCGEAFDGKTFVLKKVECQAGDAFGLPPEALVISDALQSWPNHVQPHNGTPDEDQFPDEGLLSETVSWDGRCFYAHLFCTGLSTTRARRGGIFAVHRGDGLPPAVVVAGNSGLTNTTGASPNPRLATVCDTLLQASAPLGTEDPFAFTATGAGGETAVVTEGGDYEPYDQFAGPWSCASCCQGDDEVPEEVTLTWAPEAGYPDPLPPAGDYTLALAATSLDTTASHLQWQYSADGVSFNAKIVPCMGEINLVTPECHRFMEGCYLSVSIGSYNADTVNNPSLDTCDELCLSVPMCSPPAGTYSLYDFGPLANGEDRRLVGTVTFA